MRMERIVGSVGVVLLLGGTAIAASLSKADKDFMVAAAKANMTEAHEGQMAENQGSADAVKSLGRTLDQDHSQAYGQLETLAQKLGVTIPNGIDTAKDATIRQLEKLKGPAFDKAFTRDEVATHHAAIAEFKREAEHGTDPDVKAYASQTVPVLEKHLTMAEQAEKAK